MNDPLVTVYVTNHNYGRFLSQAVESVLAQTLNAYEIIIIDDGSTDHSREIIEGFSGRGNIRIVYQQRKGLNITNNIALRLARGRYIMRLDADDYLEPNALLVMSRLLESNKDLGLVFPDYYLVDAHGNILNIERRHSFVKEVSLLDMPAHGACTMIRRQALLDVGGYDESFTCQDGYDLWLKFIDRYTVRNINLPLFYYRQHGANLTRNEDRILETRSAIKRVHAERNGHTLAGMALIPVRDEQQDIDPLAMRSLGGRRILDRLIETCLQVRSLRGLVVTSSGEAVAQYVRETYAAEPRVVYIPRPRELARANVSLGETAQWVLADDQVGLWEADALVALSPQCPFISSKAIEEALHSMILFQAESVIGLRPVQDMLYRHTGTGMEPILDQQRFMRLERDALWRNVGALYVGTTAHIRDTGMISGDRLSHVTLSQREAHAIHSDFDWWLAEHLADQEEIGTPN